MRSRNSDAYADYYLLLESCVYYYDQYQIQIHKLNIITLTAQVATLTNEKMQLDAELEDANAEHGRTEATLVLTQQVNIDTNTRVRGLSENRGPAQ